jgi:hypothetical protein
MDWYFNTLLALVILIRVTHLVSLLELFTLTLSSDIWTVHVFPVVVYVLLGQVVRC